MIIPRVRIVPKSGDSKTGPVPVTYRHIGTCPPDCIFRPDGEIGGCYGTGRIFALADTAADVSVSDAAERIERGRDRAARVFRDRIVGDMVRADGRLERRYAAGIAAVADIVGLPVIGYSHAWRTFTVADVSYLGGLGYIPNASCETVGDVSDAIGRGFPAVITSDTVPERTVIGGRRVITCPAARSESVSCNTCRLCARPDRPTVVRFPIHGPAHVRAARAVAARETADREWSDRLRSDPTFAAREWSRLWSDGGDA